MEECAGEDDLRFAVAKAFYREGRKGSSAKGAKKIGRDWPLADYQDFAHVVAGEEEFDRGEVAEKIFDVAVVEHALKLEAI